MQDVLEEARKQVQSSSWSQTGTPQVGFAAKGVVYALIGGLACQSAATGVTTNRGADKSPQGAFILLGNNDFGYPLLVVMAVSVYMYVCWRFWEGITGQGSDHAFGPMKNFFKYRLSPVVSGCVYTAYGAFCISLIPKVKDRDFSTAAHSGAFPQSVAGTWWGNTIIAVLGIAFLIATIIQLQAAFTRNFHYEMKEDLPTCFTWLLIVTGHIGFLGRSGVFLFVAVLMFRTIRRPDINSTDETTIGNALSQLQKTHGGRAGLFILGCLLLVYGTFAVLNSYAKVFPTEPPSGRSVRDSSPQWASWQAHVDELDAETRADRQQRRTSIGEPAWNHSDSKRRLRLQRLQIQALASSSSAATAKPGHGTWDYERSKQERLQAIKNLELMVVSTDEQPIQQMPLAGSELAEIRVSLEDIPDEVHPQLFMLNRYNHDGDDVPH
ncbi:hypothetical protein ABBQ32_009829 [Trebouxia sp. C0010 RCD-2024]